MSTPDEPCLEVDVSTRGQVLAGLVESTLDELGSWFPKCGLAIYVEHQLDEPAIARVRPAAAPCADDVYPLELRFASWLTVLDSTRVRSVPTYLQPWLSFAKALVVPLLVEGNHRGAIVVEPSAMGRTEVTRVERLSIQVAEKLAEIERLAPHGVDHVRGRFADSVHRIKISTRP